MAACLASERQRRIAAPATERPVAVASFGPTPQEQKPEGVDVMAHDQPRDRIAERDDQCGIDGAIAPNQHRRASNEKQHRRLNRDTCPERRARHRKEQRVFGQDFGVVGHGAIRQSRRQWRLRKIRWRWRWRCR